MTCNGPGASVVQCSQRHQWRLTQRVAGSPRNMAQRRAEASPEVIWGLYTQSP